MKLTNEDKDKICSRLSDLACECDFMREEANLRQFAIGCYSNNDSDTVIRHLRDVLRRADNLLDDLHCVQATLDGLLVQSRVLDEAEMI